MDFQYEAKARDGKLMRGTYAADKEADVISWVRNQNWTPINVTRPAGITFSGAANTKAAMSADGKGGAKGLTFELPIRVKTRDKLVFFRQLATMITAGIPITASLAILIDQTSNKAFKRTLRQVYNRVSAGTTLGNALAEHPKVFDKITIPLIKSGEESGTLDESLVKLATFMESQDELHKKIVSAMTYPSVVIVIALLVLGVMVTVVIPQFEKAFGNLNIQMPWLTMMTFKLGKWMQGHWYYIPLTIIFFVMGLIKFRLLKTMKMPIDVFLLKIPVFGDIVFKSSCTRAFRTMSSLLKSGVPVLQALEMTADVAGNEKIRQSFLEMRTAAMMGTPLNAVIREKKLFPPMIGHMVAVGEETGRTDEMLEKIADWYDTELSEKVKRLSSILEPIMVVFVGVIVGFMVLAIFLPIISAINAFM